MPDSTKPAKRKDVAGSTIVITGASSGFGRGAALRLAANGAHVVLAARRGAALDALAVEIEGAGGLALAVATDVSDAAQVTRLAEAAVQRFGRFDVWVNNAAVGAMGFFWDTPIEDHARIIDVNLKGQLYGAHVALRQFRQQGAGTLINVGSVGSEVPLAYQVAYSASKAGVLSMSRSLREELRLAGDHDINVTTILPWAADTPWWTHVANYTGHAPRMPAMDDPEVVVEAIVDACIEPKEEVRVSWVSKASNASHHFFPDLTERMSAKMADREVEKGSRVAPTHGAVHQPMAGTEQIVGGVRARMKQEDAGKK